MPADNATRPPLPEIVLVSAGEIGSGALEAHLGELARRLSPHARVHWAALGSPRAWLGGAAGAARRRFEDTARRAVSGSVVVVPHGPRFSALASAGVALGLALSRRVGPGPLVLHARGYLATLAAAGTRRVLRRARVVHDVRGDRPAEARAHGGEFPAERVAALEARACAAADAHLAVSRPLAALLHARHGVNADVFQSAADTETFRPDPAGRERVRAELGLGDAFVLGFVGSCAPWQRPDAVAAAFLALRRAETRARLLVVSPDGDAWARELARHGVEADVAGASRSGAVALVRRAPHDQMPAWFSACDATLLLRDQDDVNRVASPIKLGESLACGVPVLLTRGIGDASELVASRGLGACFDDPFLRGAEDDSRLRAFLERRARDVRGLQAECRRAAVEEWSWTMQVPRRLELYRALAMAGPGTAPCDNPASSEIVA